MKKLTIGLCAMLAMSSTAFAHEAQVTDVNKNVINRVPYNVEVCTNVTSGGDKSGDMLKGSIIGGILGGAAGGTLATKKNWIWSIPTGVVGGALVGCQVDGG